MKTQKLFLVILILPCLALVTCKPDALKKEATFEVENNSTSDNITGVYYAKSDYGTNRLSGNIGPGGTRSFTLDAEGDYIYNIKVTTDNANISDYTFDDVHFYDGRRVTVELTEDGWDDYFSY